MQFMNLLISLRFLSSVLTKSKVIFQLSSDGLNHGVNATWDVADSKTGKDEAELRFLCVAICVVDIRGVGGRVPDAPTSGEADGQYSSSVAAGSLTYCRSCHRAAHPSRSINADPQEQQLPPSYDQLLPPSYKDTTI